MWGRPPPDAYLTLDVHPVERATPEDLVALGKALQAWMARAGRRVEVMGLDELLQGRYPSPCEVFDVVPDPEGEIDMGERGRYTIPTPWEYCVARITAHTDIEHTWALRASLAAAIPPEVGRITEASGGHW